MKINKLAREIYKGDQYKIFVDAGLTETNCTGRSTSLALKYIATSLENPGFGVQLAEHGLPRDAMAGGFVALVERLIYTLDLRFMKVNPAKLTLTYDLFEEVQEEVDPLALLYEQLTKATAKGDLEAITTYSQAIQRLRSI